MTTQARDTRIPLSLRLPAREVGVVHDYADKHKLSKTDAFLYFLRKGIESDTETDPQLKEIKDSLQEVLRLIGNTTTVLTQADIMAAVQKAALVFPAIEKVFLFGSFARGEETPESDIDLRLEIAEESTFSLFDLNRFKTNIEKETGRSVDAITAKELKNPNLVRTIEKEKVLLYERTQ